MFLYCAWDMSGLPIVMYGILIHPDTHSQKHISINLFIFSIPGFTEVSISISFPSLDTELTEKNARDSFFPLKSTLILLRAEIFS